MPGRPCDFWGILWSRAAPSRGGKGEGCGVSGGDTAVSRGDTGWGWAGGKGTPPPPGGRRRMGCPHPRLRPGGGGAPFPHPPKAGAGTVTSAVPTGRSGPQLHREHRAALQQHAASPQRGAPPHPTSLRRGGGTHADPSALRGRGRTRRLRVPSSLPTTKEFCTPRCRHSNVTLRSPPILRA